LTSAIRHRPASPSGLAAHVQQLLETLMLDENMSAKELGKRAGVSDTTVLRVLKGQRIPSLAVVDQIFAGLGYAVTIHAAPDNDLAAEAAERRLQA
jgi:transcriptional regulator with XRE-family HTH domain